MKIGRRVAVSRCGRRKGGRHDAATSWPAPLGRPLPRIDRQLLLDVWQDKIYELFVLDAKGVIRYKNILPEKVDEAIDGLLEEVEQEKQ